MIKMPPQAMGVIWTTVKMRTGGESLVGIWFGGESWREGIMLGLLDGRKLWKRVEFRRKGDLGERRG
jgi:hypothetical protein